MTIGEKIHHLKKINSTMEACANLVTQGAPSGTIVSTNYQDSGRGRFNRKWLSPNGDNIQMSIILRPTQGELKYLNMFASMAVLATCEEVMSCNAAIKWPNDVQINGRKISGILTESIIEGDKVISSIVGIGLNVNLNVESQIDIKKTATSIKNEKGRYASRSVILKTLIKNLNIYHSKIIDGKSLRKQWSQKLSTLGQTVSLSFGQ
ncbi:MAG: biotin--[acetyl-CoA-carboxylase] ligase, partial [Chloroflexota bacterium]|nr:biotin--[acetyl-CoA-carboxylase] ligase [Chloroflexota bacterium]MED5450232.1 biotin--[acetyl-CoA-carboxylase] ligase [Chloroflexota bacterium]